MSLVNTRLVAFATLTTTCFALQLEAVCTNNGLTPSCDVYDVIFTSESDTQLTATTYKMSLTDQTTDAQKSAIFDDVITAARADTLVSGSTVVVNSLRLGTCKISVLVL